MNSSRVHYSDVREAVLALRWGPIHCSRLGSGLWCARAGGRVGYGEGPGTAVLALLVTNATAVA